MLIMTCSFIYAGLHIQAKSYVSFLGYSPGQVDDHSCCFGILFLLLLQHCAQVFRNLLPVPVLSVSDINAFFYIRI
jgi:hypothetical protein